ncbi:BACON domain-containing protein [Phocaeicola coprocola]|uniref:BACON domain-containing protein n=1 Tax=Phocaeicola coprocola TaxID=310298 RepID=UPI00267073BA|nr:BACON domain-containing carbohydrate-binding protein [Phocaeicola coprocola]
MKKFMKWMPISMMILGSMFMFAACSDDNEPTTPEEPGTETPGAKVSIQLGYESIEVEAAGGSAEVTYTLKNAGTNPKISGTSDQDWITDIQAADGKVTMSVAANTETADRTAKVTLTYSDDEKNAASAELTVTQGAKAEEKFTITIPGESGSTWIPFEIQPKDQSAQYFLNIRPAEEMEGFVSDEALFNSDMSFYQELADQYGMSLNDVLVATGALVSGPMEDYLFTKLSPSTEYCIYCYGVENGKLVAPVSKVNAATTAAAPVDNQITIDVTNKIASSVAFTVKVTTFDAYALAIFDGSASDAEIESALMGEDVSIYAGNQQLSLNTALEVGKEYAIAAIGRAGNTATTKLVVTRFTAEEGQVVENLTLDMTALAFDGDELAAHLGVDDLKGRPILFNNIETNGTYTLTYPVTVEELADLRKQVEEQNPGEEITDETLYAVILNAFAAYSSPDRQSLWLASEGSWVVLSMTIDEAQKNYKVGSVDIEVNENTYSPVEEIDKYLDLNTSKVLFKKAGNLDVKAAAAAVKKYLDKKYTFKTSIESQSMIKSMKK